MCENESGIDWGWTFQCEEVKKLLNREDIECCGSCHSETEELGIEPCEIEVEGVWYHVCCAIPWEDKDEKTK